jgi:hypothetical protein
LLTLDPYTYILAAVDSRKFVCLFALIFIVLASFCLVPAGHGPYSAVYGPRTSLRAYRSSLQLMQAVVAIVIFSLIIPGLRFGRERLPRVAQIDCAFTPLPSLISILRC